MRPWGIIAELAGLFLEAARETEGETFGLWRLGSVFVDIALHRRGPEDLPASRFLLGVVLLLYLSVTLVSLRLTEPMGRAAGLAAYDTALYLGFVWLVLRVLDHSRRFVQTATALLGTETFLTLIGVPLLVWIDLDTMAAGVPTLATVLFLLLFLWSVDVAGFVISRALQSAYVVGVLIVIGYILGSWRLRGLLFPVAG